MENNNDLKKWIKKFCVDNDINCTRLAREIFNCSVAYMSAIVNLKRPLPKKYIKLLSDKFKVSKEDLDLLNKYVVDKVNKSQQILELKAENERLKEEHKFIDDLHNYFETETLQELKNTLAEEVRQGNALLEITSKLEQQLKEKDEEIARYKKFLATRQFTDEKLSFDKIEELKCQIKEKDEHIKVLLENELDKTKRILNANTHQVCEKIRKVIDDDCLGMYLDTYSHVTEVLDQIEKGEENGK